VNSNSKILYRKSPHDPATLITRMTFLFSNHPTVAASQQWQWNSRIIQ